MMDMDNAGNMLQDDSNKRQHHLNSKEWPAAAAKSFIICVKTELFEWLHCRLQGFGSRVLQQDIRWKSKNIAKVQGLSKILSILVNYRQIEYYDMLAKVGVYHYNGNNVDLSTTCGKYYRECCLSIINLGDFDIIESIPGD
ncbi:uncharacterized protein LOC127095369 [Lathyrus oleraceus]|uniref:uncharacterized protein LOC127095369 n=1 Tax=Pisum sativum TaxID=3888 RepID=UPI0021D10872|nr:uncharacterized protein LOC127095369 [Pisum sativum]